MFDIDGTLTNSVKQHQDAFRAMLLEIGVEDDFSDFKTFKHHTDFYIAKEIYEYTTKNVFSKEKYNQFEKGLTERITAQKINEIKGANHLITMLNQDDSSYLVCFATGSLKRPAIHKLNSIGIAFEDWQLVASDCIYEREKIVEQAINNAKKHSGISTFKRIISVGDGLWDLKTAENLKLEFIGIGNTNKEILLKQGAHVVCEDLRNFESVIEQYNVIGKE